MVSPNGTGVHLDFVRNLYKSCSSFTILHPFGEKMVITPKPGIILTHIHNDIGLLQRFEERNNHLSLCGKYKPERGQQARAETGVLLSTSSNTNTKKRSDSLDKRIAAKIGGKHRKTKRRIKTKRHKKITCKYKKYGKTRKNHKK